MLDREAEQKTIELLALSTEAIESMGIHAEAAVMSSRVFSNLKITVADVYAE